MSIVKTVRTSADGGVFRPQLTSLIDVMTILLVFLIKSFSVEGDLVTPSDDLMLPISTSDKLPKQQCAIEITKKSILGDGQVITELNNVDSSDTLLIAPLFRWVQSKSTQCGDSLRGREMMIQCDRDIAYVHVKRVMYSCSKAGFSRFSVLVIQEEQ